MVVMNREASRPLYLQIKTVMEEKILSGCWPRGGSTRPSLRRSSQ